MNLKKVLIITLIFTNFLQAYSQNPKNIILMIGDGMGFNHLEA